MKLKDDTFLLIPSALWMFLQLWQLAVICPSNHTTCLQFERLEMFYGFGDRKSGSLKTGPDPKSAVSLCPQSHFIDKNQRYISANKKPGCLCIWTASLINSDRVWLYKFYPWLHSSVVSNLCPHKLVSNHNNLFFAHRVQDPWNARHCTDKMPCYW